MPRKIRDLKKFLVFLSNLILLKDKKLTWEKKKGHKVHKSVEDGETEEEKLCCLLLVEKIHQSWFSLAKIVRLYRSLE